MANYSDLHLLKRLIPRVRPYWLQILGLFLLSLFSVPLALLQPLPLKIAVDSVIGSEPLPGFLASLIPNFIIQDANSILIFAVSLLILTALLQGIQNIISNGLRVYTGEKLVLDFRSQIFDHLQKLSLSYHDSQGTSDSLYRVQSDANAIKYILTTGLVTLVSAGFQLLAMLIIILRLNWELALIALAVSPFFVTLAQTYRRSLRRKWKNLYKIRSAAMSVVQEVLGSIRVVKAFGQEPREHQRFMGHSDHALRENIQVSVFEGSLSLLMGLTTAMGTAGVLFVGIQAIESGELTLGELLLVMGYLSQLYGPLRTLSSNLTQFQSHLASMERVFLLLDEPVAVFDKPDAQVISRAVGGVAFRNVSFGYETQRQILQNISFEISPGTRLGIIGHTGAGKTTLLNLLTRFYDPTEGAIVIDGVDLRDYKLADLRHQFAIVLQEPVLFSTTIAENIAYGNPGATEEEIITAAKAANAHEFVSNLSEGYETQVGERGMQVSGGERQRIGLARAFLKDAPILILDEPTSSVDLKTETAILEAMEKLMQNRTTFTIAHRLSTLENYDLLLVLEQGRIVQMTSEVSQFIQAATMKNGF
ncbi:MAG: ABC transporter ATP-binding protein [Microcoleaceae cyanobacterium]